MKLTQKQLDDLQKRRAGLGFLSKPAQAAQTQKQKVQALGRLKVGEKNNTETAYGEHLEWLKHTGKVAWYRFEGIKLRLATKTSLTVDYAVMRSDGVLEMHDVKGSKGIYFDDAKVKMKIAAEMYPFIFKIIYPIPKGKGGGWNVEEV